MDPVERLSRIWRKICPDLFKEFYASSKGDEGVPIEGALILLVWGLAVVFGIAAFLDMVAS